MFKAKTIIEKNLCDIINKDLILFDNFWDDCFEKAIKLKKRFEKIEEKKWDELTISNELVVQLGHLSFLVTNDEYVKEEGRDICNYNDEIADVLLQLCALCNKLKIDRKDIKLDIIDEKITEEKAILEIYSLVGQIIETLLEIHRYRFDRPRKGHTTKKQFIENRMSKIFSILFSIINDKQIDIIYEFDQMCEDANHFLDKKITKEVYNIVDLHASWLALNPIQGCPNKCRYCFMNGTNLTATKPIELVNPKEAVEMLLKSNLYDEKIPLCIETETDAFATSKNIKYVIELLTQLKQNNIQNTIVFITKCEIPDYFIEEIKRYDKNKFIFFLSYSGLNRNIEIGINKEKIKENFIKLKNEGLNIVHYWRPFIPENSSKEKILEVYNFVKNYAKCSVAIGLKVNKSYKDKLDFWPELKNIKDIEKYESIWTFDAYNYIWGENIIIEKDYPIFKTTSCAIAYVLNKAEKEACYNSSICKYQNRCPKNQRKLCDKYYSSNKKINKEYVLELIKKLEYNIDSLKINIDEKNKVINIEGIDLLSKDFSYLTLMTHFKVVAKKNESDYYWNSFISDAKQLIVQ